MFEHLKYVESISQAHSIIAHANHTNGREIYIAKPLKTIDYTPATGAAIASVEDIRRVNKSDFLQAWISYQNIYLKNFIRNPYMSLCSNLRGIAGVLDFVVGLPHAAQYFALDKKIERVNDIVVYRHNLREFRLECWNKKTGWQDVVIDGFEEFKHKKNLGLISQLLDEIELAITQKIYLPPAQFYMALDLISCRRKEIENPDYDD